MSEVSASISGASSMRPLSLTVALLIVLGGSIYPFMFAGKGSGVDHGFAFAIFWAMSAGLVNGVGFKPIFLLWRGLFSGWACLFALLLAAWLRLT